MSSGVKKCQIFISSTYEGLKKEREVVQRAISSEYHIPVGMEFFCASDNEQWDIIKETIDTSDYYALIIARAYGTIIKDGLDAGISYTEKEFRYALDNKIPILAFVLDKDAQPEREFDKEPEKREGLEKFKNTVLTGRAVAFWESADQLAWKVNAAITRAIRNNPRPGWVRGTISVSESVEESICVTNDVAETNKEVSKAEPGNVEGVCTAILKHIKLPDFSEEGISKASRFLDVIKTLERGFTISELSAATGLSMASVKHRVQKMVSEGEIERVGTGRFSKYVYIGDSGLSDGYHEIFNRKNVKLREGIWKNGELFQGREFNYVIKDANGKLVYSHDSNDYIGSPVTEINEMMPFYDDRYQLEWMMPYLEHEGLDNYYICDLAVDKTKASGYEVEYYNIRKLGDWLEENEPETYRQVMAIIDKNSSD